MAFDQNMSNINLRNTFVLSIIMRCRTIVSDHQHVGQTIWHGFRLGHQCRYRPIRSGTVANGAAKDSTNPTPILARPLSGPKSINTALPIWSKHTA